ncbi:hypothetical protein SAY87_017581 [Trapa incisa]|uniref:Uncharacterized protein n=1 Tax=Trapa incisa TaxID=236973 RepID=A0AAN7QS07_9MYRT|nr:hypothetical protein SAY87_017581 [Trapa incisa]
MEHGGCMMHAAYWKWQLCIFLERLSVPTHGSPNRPIHGTAYRPKEMYLDWHRNLEGGGEREILPRKLGAGELDGREAREAVEEYPPAAQGCARRTTGLKTRRISTRQNGHFSKSQDSGSSLCTKPLAHYSLSPSSVSLRPPVSGNLISIFSIKPTLRGRGPNLTPNNDHRRQQKISLISIPIPIHQFRGRKRVQMSSSSRACVVAASVAVVEALKDQGICRWNYPIRCAVQSALNRARPISQAKNFSPQPSSSMTEGSSKIREEEMVKQSEESLRKVMYLSCWGPN